jgi:hypothetical protein
MIGLVESGTNKQFLRPEWKYPRLHFSSFLTFNDCKEFNESSDLDVALQCSEMPRTRSILIVTLIIHWESHLWKNLLYHRSPVKTSTRVLFVWVIQEYSCNDKDLTKANTTHLCFSDWVTGLHCAPIGAALMSDARSGSSWTVSFRKFPSLRLSLSSTALLFLFYLRVSISIRMNLTQICTDRVVIKGVV